MPEFVVVTYRTRRSVTLDGVSLTVSSLGADWFEVALIPETLGVTTLGGLAVVATVS